MKCDYKNNMNSEFSGEYDTAEKLLDALINSARNTTPSDFRSVSSCGDLRVVYSIDENESDAEWELRLFDVDGEISREVAIGILNRQFGFAQ